MSTPAFKIISQQPISKEEYEKNMNKKRSLPTRDEIAEEYSDKRPNDDAAQIQKAYEEIIEDIRKRRFELFEKGYISSFVDFDGPQMVKLFKLIVANPGYQIGLSAEYSNWEHIPIPNNLLDWEDLTKVFPTDSFLIYLK